MLQCRAVARTVACQLLRGFVGLALVAPVFASTGVGLASFEQLLHRSHPQLGLHQQLAHGGHTLVGGVDLALIGFDGVDGFRVPREFEKRRRAATGVGSTRE